METQCFKSAWLAVALHEGFGFPPNYPGLSAAPETVNGRVVHWTIGALLYRTRFLPLRYGHCVTTSKCKSCMRPERTISNWNTFPRLLFPM